MAHSTSTALELDLESSSPALQLLLDKRDIQQQCINFSRYCRNYYLAIPRQIPEEVESFISDLNAVAKTAGFGSEVILLSATPKISYLQSSLAPLARYNPDFPVRVVLAMKIAQWKVDPLPFINQELRRCRTNASELRPFMSDFKLSSQSENMKSQSHTIEWFRYSPKLLGFFDLIRNPKCYVHRVESTQTHLYISPGGTVSRRALIVFNDTASLKQFYYNVKCSTAEITVPSLAEVLADQIINDTVKFITELAHEVHNAKYKGLREPKATVLEFLLLATEHLRELPQVLERTSKTIKGLQESVSDLAVNNSNEPEVNQSSLLQNSMSPDPEGSEPNLILRPSTESVVIELSALQRSLSNPSQSDIPAVPDRTEPPTIHGPLGPLELSPASAAWANRTKDLDELNQASKDLLVEAIAAKDASFFAMNFKAVKEPDNNPILPGLKLFWAVALSLCFGTIVVPVIGPKLFQWIIGNNIRLLLKFLFDCIMLALRWVKTLEEPVVGGVFILFFEFIPLLAPASAFMIWQSYRRLRKGKNGT
ncbi:hypothetical protein BDD12DRAFT_803353 [Trichophaea hybrida]|nr:hypothetical protein BDD12DRAFT_803353 [Trichophaea hybrida]